jgi:uncharacterized membrane protein YjjP (DUF1212 family)
MQNINTKQEVEDLGTLLLKIGAHLMSSGANGRRIRSIIDRIADSFGCNVELLITHRAINLSITDDDDHVVFSGIKRTSPHGVNYRIVSGISRMSWRVMEDKWTVGQVEQELERLLALPHYNRLLILSTVALAGASFCRLFGGSYTDMMVAFGATFIGLFVRQELIKRDFNAYLSVFTASLTASLVSGFYLKHGIDLSATREHAFATSVLFLIPGVPFINSITDLMDGNIMNGLVRGMNGAMIAFAIALGLVSAMFIYNI